jgi:hypothetical protein
MGILDKLKPQPRWKHADPAVRLEAIRELEEPAELAALAEADPEVKVRRAAVAVLDDPDCLGRIAAGDPDADTRDRASDRLVTLACRPLGSDSLDADATLALRAVAALGDPRRLSVVAKSDALNAVRTKALARITDERALGSIARHARDESTAAAALARVTDAGELLDVALNSDHRDVALAAFDRVTGPTPDLAQLHAIELRAQQKMVSRRARALIQELEAAEAARQTAALERQRRESTLTEAVEHLAELTDLTVARAELARLNESWQALAVTDEAALDRFGRASRRAEEAFLRREREAEEEADRQRARAEALATRAALCERVETLEGDDVLAQLVPIEEEWRSLLPLVGNGPEADRLAERFAQAVAACRKRHEMGAQLAEASASLDALVTEAEALTSREDVADAEARWQGLSREARGLTALLDGASRPASADLTARLEAVSAHFAAHDAARQAEADAARQKTLQLLQRLAERTRRVVDAESMTLREGERLMRDISAGLEAAGAAGTGRDLDQAAAALRALQEQVAPRVRELREMDEWRRFANAQRQEQLISMAEAIVNSLKTEESAGQPSDLAATARALRELHAEWQQVAEAPRQTAQRLWDRFRTATDFIRSRCEPFFAQRRDERAAAARKRAAIVEDAEALASSSDWVKTASRLQELQGEWQGLGRLVTDNDRELGQRFRTACNAFFSRRREDLLDRKKVWTENLSRKEALCERAESLAESTDWDAAAAEMKRLQAEWKTIGPVRKNKSEVVWTRFRAAADRFFERYHHRHEIGLAAKLAEREALVIDLEQLGEVEEPPADLAERVQQLRTTWSRSVPVPVPGMKAVADRWQAALGRLVAARPDVFAGTDLDPAAVLHRMEKLLARVEALVSDQSAAQQHPQSQTELLAARLRSAFANNAMGGRTADASKSRAAIDTVRDAQAAWQRLPPIESPEARGYAVRFREACRRIAEQNRHSHGPAAGGSRNQSGSRPHGTPRQEPATV